jgi:4a-hydroxytetrahydrobiopterin dehydratase
MTSPLLKKRCQELKPGSPSLKPAQISRLLRQLKGWKSNESGQIEKVYKFDDYYHTMAFVNAVAWIANQENHHPDLMVKYSQCVVKFSTHSVGGLSENDFISAAKVDALFG